MNAFREGSAIEAALLDFTEPMIGPGIPRDMSLEEIRATFDFVETIWNAPLLMNSADASTAELVARELDARLSRAPEDAA